MIVKEHAMIKGKKPNQCRIQRMRPIARIFNSILRNEEFASMFDEIRIVHSSDRVGGGKKILLSARDLRTVTEKYKMVEKWKRSDYRRIRLFIMDNTEEMIELFDYLNYHKYDDKTVNELPLDLWKCIISAQVKATEQQLDEQVIHEGNYEEQLQNTTWTMYDMRRESAEAITTTRMTIQGNNEHDKQYQEPLIRMTSERHQNSSTYKANDESLDLE